MLTNMIRDFKKKVKESYVIGPFSKTQDPAFIEIMGYSGFDFVILDLEHGPNSVQTLQNLVRAAQVANILPVVRVKENNLSIIGEVLDIGAAAIQVPQVENARQARSVVRRAKFAPLGERGVCRFVRAAGYSSMDRFSYFKEANESMVILQIEGQDAIAGLRGILEVEGIDLIFIGPYDLSQSLGISGQIDHPLVTQKMMEIVDICSKKGIGVGTFVDTPDNAIKWRNAGVKYISYSVDVGIFYQACRDILSGLRGSKPNGLEDEKDLFIET
ncbi:MAG: aldolase/citrate lyase family protein [Clostridiales bacterium]|jgi:4-hydroxy-2-oxoheptanedioate aldolase|nr:aldolase/citrate lyase family protein [Eubacteriales bacterium]MDH7567153.1 aldolase/citrate lyase family protein [Clostridiales bacterium]